MAQPRYISKTLTAGSATAIAASQTPTGAGNLTLTANPVVLSTHRQVSIAGNGNDSGITFTVTGTTFGGAVLSETVTGGNATPYAVTTVNMFKTVTNVAVSGATAAAVTVGTNGVGTTEWLIVNWHVTPINIGLCVVVTGTANYTVQYCYDDPSGPPFPDGTYPNPTGAYPTPFNHSVLAAQSTTKDGSITTPVSAIRLQINSGTGTAQMIFLQADLSGP